MPDELGGGFRRVGRQVVGLDPRLQDRRADPRTQDPTPVGEPFVRVVDHLPGTKDAAHTNFCDVTARIVRDRVLTISCIDNLIKGASGAAVQNFNLMFGYPETAGF